MTPRIFCTLTFTAGLLLWRSPWPSSFPGIAALALLALWQPTWRGPKANRAWLLLAVALAAGVTRAALDDALEWRPSDLRVGKVATFYGNVLEAPRQWGRSLVFFFSVSRVDDRQLDQPVLVLVRWSGGEDVVAPGECWALAGRFVTAQKAAYPGGFSQEFWLWTQRAQGVVSLNKFSDASYQGPPVGWGPRALAARLRLIMLARLEGIEHPTARSLIAGVVFGDTQALPKDVQDQFRRTGTSHLLAASGMNVALLIGLFVGFARLLGYGSWRVAPALIPLAIGYAFLAGCAPSIARAAAAAVMGLLAAWWGRSSGAWNSLCLSVWILLLWEPRQIYDPGFQLSVAAVIGLIAGPTLAESAPGWKKSSLMTISACLLTLPIMWTMFGELSVTLLPANLILGPLVECLFPLGLLLTLLPFPPLFWGAEQLARLSLFLVREISWIADPVPLSNPGPGSLALLGFAILLWIGPKRVDRRWAIPLAALALWSGQSSGLRPTAAPGELVVRQVGVRKPYYWLSSHREELLVLTERWQEKRARSMLLDMGCLREPQIKVLRAEQLFTVRWGVFSWGKVYPLLPKAPYVEIRTTGCTYQAREWRP